jgi:hypothetical protein
VTASRRGSCGGAAVACQRDGTSGLPRPRDYRVWSASMVISVLLVKKTDQNRGRSTVRTPGGPPAPPSADHPCTDRAPEGLRRTGCQQAAQVHRFTAHGRTTADRSSSKKLIYHGFGRSPRPGPRGPQPDVLLPPDRGLRLLRRRSELPRTLTRPKSVADPTLWHASILRVPLHDCCLPL